MLSDEERFYVETDTHFIPTPARYKREAPFLKEVDSSALATVHQDLRKAFQWFFDDPSTYRHPTYKKETLQSLLYRLLPILFRREGH